MKKYLPIAILALIIILPILLGIFLASERATRQINRLEQDIVIVQNTQFDLFQQIATKSATVSGKVK